MMLTNSKTQQLKPQDILKTALTLTESPHDLPYAVAAITKELKAPETISFVIGNTLFIVNKSTTNKKHAMFRALNADIPPNYLQNSKDFIKEMKNANFTVLVSRFNNRTILNIFKAISKNPPFPKMGYIVQRLRKGGYQATINMGEA